MKLLFILLIALNPLKGQKGNVNLKPLIQNTETRDIKSDTANLLNISRAIDREGTERPVEKVYLHIDKPSYSPGDTIWYKAYLTIGPDHKLSTLSNVLYCELIDSKDSVIQRSILHVKNGVSWGNLTLSKHYKNGIYHLRAYTNWMRNHSSEFFYNRRFFVGPINPPLVKNYIYVQPDVQFFPEGGELVNGLRCRVAFKAIDRNGYGTELSGKIIDKNGDEITTFNTQHLGMGKFAFTPEKGNNYIAKINSGNHVFFVKIPKIHDDGFNLNINNSSPDSLAIRVTASKNSLAAFRQTSLYILAQSEGRVYYGTTFSLEAGSNIALINKSRFPAGIVQFTLFSSVGEPLNERIVFVNKQDSLIIKAPILKPAYGQREHMNFDIKVSNPQGFPVVGNFSVSVINEDLISKTEVEEPNIITSLLFNSALKGHIEHPDYYFSNDPEAEGNLDLLMLTQGYRKLNWKYIISTKNIPLPQFQPEKSLQVSGILKTNNDQAVVNGTVQLITNDEKLRLLTTTDKAGNFKFSGLDLPEKSKITIFGTQENGDDKVLYQERKFAPAEYTYRELKGPLPRVLTDTSVAKVVNNETIEQKPNFVNDGIILDEVKIKEKPESNDCHCLVYIYSGNPNQDFKNYSFQGYAVTKEFYSPKYDVTNIKKRKKDTRSTAYWNPQLLTDKDGKVSFNYFNPDVKGTYRIVIEGLNNDGLIGRNTLRYQVQ